MNERINSTENAIEVYGLSCRVGYKYLLKDIDWQVKRGERWVVFGMNGSGKTTLLSIIAGFKHYSSGEISLLGETLSNENILAMRKKIGWVSASFFDKYYSKEAVNDIVLSGKYGTLGIGYDITTADRKKASRLLDELGLSERKNYTFDMLSKGERQNVLIARALFNTPEILILDEPCTGLDIYNREYLFKTLEVLQKEKNMTIVYVTHYAEEIKPYFDKCLLLKNGHIFAKGKTTELFTAEKISLFLNHRVNVEIDSSGEMHIIVQDVTPKVSELLDSESGGEDR